MAWLIGVDSGGTFTDICLFDESSGRIAVCVPPSEPANRAFEYRVATSRAIAAQTFDAEFSGAVINLLAL